jgi:hypothetical protein
VPSQSCLGPICFYALDANGPKIFGFGEYLAGLALIVLAWTIADTRYKFRVEIAPLPLQHLAFVSVALIGLLALLTDLWRAQQWLVPVGGPLSPTIWQALLGLAFLLHFSVGLGLHLLDRRSSVQETQSASYDQFTKQFSVGLLPNLP